MNPCFKTVSEIESILRSRFDLTADVQVIHPKGETRALYLLENIPLNRRMTAAGLERLCRRIAKALDANLYDSVNLEFDDAGATFEMMAEIEGKEY